ncbi:MAG: NADH-quinone oxidoreductase subunit NuoK [Candidatus Eisenbacteria bacterium]
MGEITTSHYVVLATILFFIRDLGRARTSGAITVLMSIELMLNAVNLVLIAGSRQWGNLEGQMVAFFVIAIAAVEAAVGLAILMAIFRAKESINLDELSTLYE